MIPLQIVDSSTDYFYNGTTTFPGWEYAQAGLRVDARFGDQTACLAMGLDAATLGADCDRIIEFTDYTGPFTTTTTEP